MHTITAINCEYLRAVNVIIYLNVCNVFYFFRNVKKLNLLIQYILQYIL